MTITALIPAYEAAATVAGVVEATRAVVPEVWVVDDGSRDRTSDEARRAGAKVIRFETNRGKGAALRAGFDQVRGRGAAVITLDADGQHDPAEIPRLVERWTQTHAGLVIGSRVHLAGEMSGLRRFGNRFSRRALTYFAGIPVLDGQSGFRLYDPSLLERVPLRGDRYEMESEVIVKAARAGFLVECVPIRLSRVDGASTSHYRPWRDTARICLTVVRSRWWRPGCS